MNEKLIIWPFWQKTLIRFFFLFFLLFIFQHDVLPAEQSFLELFIQPFRYIAGWLGQHLFEFTPVNFDGHGSGDTSGDYLLLLVIAVLTIAGTVIWSVIDKRRANYSKVLYWLIIIVRYYLVGIMIGYGLVKIFKTQFPYPSPQQLNETYGQSSPMALAWTFFGYSAAYNYFMGFAELSCAFLLTFRRTTLLGSLLTLAVTANIMAINYCFDVPVKIFSTMLVVMSLFLIAISSKRLLSFFFLNRAIQPENIKPVFETKWKNSTLISVKYVLLGLYLIYNIIVVSSLATNLHNIKPNILIGDYVAVNEQNTLKADTTGAEWENVAITDEILGVTLTNRNRLNFRYKNDTEHQKLVLFSDTSINILGELAYRYVEPNTVYLDGKLDKNKIDVKLRLDDWAKSSLIRRGFHWVNEYPYNQ